MLRLMVLQIAKHHNLYSEADRYMRQFARVCFGFKGIDRADIADQLEVILNAEVSITGPTKTKAINLIKPQVNDFDTVHPNILQKLEFPFLPAPFKLQKLRSHRAIRDELFKIKELRNLLTNISRKDDFLREKLASNLSEFAQVI